MPSPNRVLLPSRYADGVGYPNTSDDANRHSDATHMAPILRHLPSSLLIGRLGQDASRLLFWRPSRTVARHSRHIGDPTRRGPRRSVAGAADFTTEGRHTTAAEPMSPIVTQLQLQEADTEVHFRTVLWVRVGNRLRQPRHGNRCDGR